MITCLWWLCVRSVSGSGPLVMLSRWGRCLASGPCLLPPDCDDLCSAAQPRSHDQTLDASPRSELLPDYPGSWRASAGQVSPHSIITEYLRWLVSTRLRQLASSINTNQLWKSNGSIKSYMDSAFPSFGCNNNCQYHYWRLIVVNLIFIIVLGFIQKRKIIPCYASSNLHVSLPWFKGIWLRDFPT